MSRCEEKCRGLPCKGDINSEQSNWSQEGASDCDGSEPSIPDETAPDCIAKEAYFRRVSHASQRQDQFMIVLGKQKDRCSLLSGTVTLRLGDSIDSVSEAERCDVAT